MEKKRNTRNPKNGYPMDRNGGRAKTGGNASRPVERKLSPMEKKIIAAENKIRKKMYAKYGNLMNQLSHAEVTELIRLNFGDDPIRAVLEETDNSIGNALRCMYGEPISRKSY